MCRIPDLIPFLQTTWLEIVTEQRESITSLMTQKYQIGKTLKNTMEKSLQLIKTYLAYMCPKQDVVFQEVRYCVNQNILEAGLEEWKPRAR